MLQCGSGKRQEISTVGRRYDAHRASQRRPGEVLTVRAVYTLGREVSQFLEIRIPAVQQSNSISSSLKIITPLRTQSEAENDPAPDIGDVIVLT